MKPATRLVLLAALLGAAFLLGIGLGSVGLSPARVVQALFAPASLDGTQLANGISGNAVVSIVRIVRLPRIITAIIAGAALSVAGLHMQTLFRNPLAGPFVLGISSGASLGVALLILGGLGLGATGLVGGLPLLQSAGVAVAAVIGSGLVMLLVLLAARTLDSAAGLLLVGLLIGYVVSALVSMLLHFSIAERIQTYVQWTFGSFGAVTWSQLLIMCLALIPAVLLSVLNIPSLNAMLLGETYARSMGVDVRAARIRIVLATAILAGIVTAFCGPIGFIGIAVPHLARGLFGTHNHRITMPAAALLGSLVAILADLASRLPGMDAVLPLNAVTALLGAPVVIAVILRRDRASEDIGV